MARGPPSSFSDADEDDLAKRGLFEFDGEYVDMDCDDEAPEDAFYERKAEIEAAFAAAEVD